MQLQIQLQETGNKRDNFSADRKLKENIIYMSKNCWTRDQTRS
jgi:hypothetical protein